MRRAVSYCYALAKETLGQDHLPRFLTHLVTFSCNARCIMCDSWLKPSENDLSLAEIEVIYRQLPQMDVVRLSGGEPFVRSDFADIAELVRRYLNPMMLHITTNGFLTQRIVEFCQNRDKRLPLFLLLSVDGFEEKHNQVRGHHKAWHYIEKTLSILAPLREELNLTLAINQTVVDKEGAEHFNLLSNWAKSFDVPVKMVMAYDASATYTQATQHTIAASQIGQFTTFGSFSLEDLRTLLDACEQPSHQEDLFTRIAKRYYLTGIRARLLNEKSGSTPAQPKCVALNQHLRLMPDGTVPTCQFNTVSAGNLRHDTFKDFWQSEQRLEQRHWVKNCPGCWAECEVLPSASYTGAIFPFAIKSWLYSKTLSMLPSVTRHQPSKMTHDKPTPDSKIFLKVK